MVYLNNESKKRMFATECIEFLMFVRLEVEVVSVPVFVSLLSQHMSFIYLVLFTGQAQLGTLPVQ